MKKTLITIALAMALVLPACAGTMKAPSDKSYKKVSDLVALPEFLPGMGTLYVKPATLPVGPFLAYDRDGTLVATIYMVPLDQMQQHKGFPNLKTGSDKVKQVDMAFNAGHPGVETPHYHLTVWHVDPRMAKVK